MKIKTSYYPKLKSLKNNKVETISISQYLLDFVDKNLIDQELKILAPTKDILYSYKNLVKTNSQLAEQNYIKEFKNYLQSINFENLITNLIDEVEKKRKKEIVLLCYENPMDFCHRHIIADEINKIANKLKIEPVKEFEHEEMDFSKEYKLPTTINKQQNRYYLMITGHANIEKSFGINIKPEDSKSYNKEIYNKIKKEIELFIKQKFMKDMNIKNIQDIVFISGMARGVDEIFLDIAEENNCNVILSIPNSIKWHQNRPLRKDGTIGQALNYQNHLNYAKNNSNNYIFEIGKKYNGKSYTYANFARNQHMIDLADKVISYRKIKSTGTDHAIKLAKQNNKYYGNIPDYIIDISKKLNNKNNSLKKGLNILYNTDLFQTKFNVGIHGANCFNTFGAGIALKIKELFPEVYEADIATIKGDRNKLGTFTYADVRNNPNSNMQYFVSLYSQYTYWNKNDMFDIKVFKKGMENIIKYFVDKRNKLNKKNVPIKFGFPAIGLGLANGNIKEIYKTLKEIEKKFKKDNIIMLLCLHPKDKKLQKEFKKLEKLNNLNYQDKTL